MTDYISAEIRRLVAERAGYRCEYCLIHENDTFFGCEVDHIISRKHGGTNAPDNLAYACVFCNRHKGADIGSISPSTGKLTRLYNPRKDRWSKHFRLNGAEIEALTGIGEVTIRILDFNNHERFLERKALISIGVYSAPSQIRRS